MNLDLGKIKFTQNSPLIHRYYLEGLHDYLLSFREELSFNFGEYIKSGGRNIREVNNLTLINEEICNGLCGVLNYIVKKYYVIDDDWVEENILGLYVQNKEDSRSVFHSHYHSTISATCYINPPLLQEGGNLEFFLTELNKPLISPQKDYIYFFPGWLMHRPTPQQTDKERMCLNWGYSSSLRPIHKLTGDRW